MAFVIYDTSPFSARDAAGLPISGAKLWFTQTGGNTPVTVYADKAGGSTLTNPVVADASGKWPGIWLSDGNETRVRYGLASASTPVGPWIDDKDGFITAVATGLGTDGSGWTGNDAQADQFREDIGAQTTVVFETRADAIAYDIDDGITTIIVNRHTANLQVCRAEYKEVTDSGTLEAWQFRSNSNTRRWELASSDVSTYHFGVGTGGDDEVPAQDFWDYVKEKKPAIARFEGTFEIGAEVIFDADNENLNETNFMLLATVTATAAMDQMMTFRQVVAATFIGRPRFRGGTSGEPYLSRLVMNGVLIDGCTGCTFDGFYVENFACDGVRIDDTSGVSNIANFGEIYSKRCGSGHDGSTDTSLISNMTVGANSGSASDFSQYTTMSSVSAFPDAYVDEATRRVGVIIGGQYYNVIQMDSGAGTVQLFPWIDSGFVGIVSARWVFGKTLGIYGTDSNVVGGDLVSSLRGGGALEVSCLYGPSIQRVLSEGGGVALTLGQTHNAQIFGGCINQLYLEGNTFDLVSSQANANFTICSTSATDSDLAKFWQGYQPRDGSNVLNKLSLNGVTILQTGGLFFKEKDAVDTTNNSITVDLNSPNKIISVYRDNGLTDFAVALTAVSANTTRLFGYDGGIRFIVHGTGDKGQPVNNIVITPPGVTTINSAAGVATFRGFSGPVMFSISYDAGTSDWKIRVLAGREVRGRVDTKAMGDADLTVTPYTDGNLVYANTTLTAGRTLTMSTTGAVEGLRWRVVRTAVSGGAFNLSVGGLKNLATGQWAEAEYDGSAYVLTAFGSL